MTLLDFARGPALQWSLIILVVGSLWRLAGIIFVRRSKDFSTPRHRITLWGALGTVMIRFWPRKEFRERAMYQEVLGYVFHIGLALVVFGFAPHIAFIKAMTGLSWPGLPNGMIMFIAGLTIFAMLALLARRMTHPVLRRISTADDYFSFLVTLVPVVTGLMAHTHMGGQYEALLAIHILSAELMLIWFPFGKLFHAILFAFSRAETGADFDRRGVRP